MLCRLDRLLTPSLWPCEEGSVYWVGRQFTSVFNPIAHRDEHGTHIWVRPYIVRELAGYWLSWIKTVQSAVEGPDGTGMANPWLQNRQTKEMQTNVLCQVGQIQKNRWRNFMASGLQTHTCLQSHLWLPWHLPRQAWSFAFILIVFTHYCFKKKFTSLFSSNSDYYN